MSNRFSSSQRGAMTLDTLFAVVMIAMMIPGLVVFMNQGNVDMAKKTVATHMQAVADAADEYVKANYATLNATATAASPVVVTIADLQSDGYLPTAFTDTNAWGQTYSIYVRQPTAGNLETLVLTSGGRGHDASRPEFGTAVVPAAAALIGAMGGYVPTGDIAAESSDTLQGAFGGWRLLFAGTGIPNPGSGHLAALLYLDGEAVTTEDYLYRVEVPGQPELNTMSTTLYMDGNEIHMGDADVGGGDGEGVASINFEDHDVSDFTCGGDDDTLGRMFFDNNNGVYVCREGVLKRLIEDDEVALIKDVQIVANQASVAYPTCSGDFPTPQIFLAPTAWMPNDTGRYIKAVQTWASSLAGSWTVNIEVLTDQGWVAPDSSHARVMVITKCSS